MCVLYLLLLLFFFELRRAPKPARTDTRFPYAKRFRSQPLPAQPRLQDRHRRPQRDRRAARQLRAHIHPGPVPAGMVARARRRAQGRTATAQPAERALRGRGPLMLDTVVAVPLWVLLAGSALCLLIAILIAV